MAETPTTQRDLLVRIMEKQDRMSTDIHEIKETVDELGDCQRKFQLSYTLEHEKLVGDVKAANARLSEFLVWKNETEKKIAAMERMWERQQVMNGIMAFVASALGVAVISYIWNLIVQ